MKAVRLTKYSHGQGCGCKISPQVLDSILKTQTNKITDVNLLVGNESRDDAAVYDLGGGEAIISTTDFFMPIVDDAFIFGAIAATNAISDIYAMGGSPIMAISIFGWPLDKLPAEVGREVIEGGRSVCQKAGITLAGGHSIDAPEPIFGLAVTGRVKTKHLKKNSTAKVGDKIYLTKPLGIGILTTALKQKKITKKDEILAINTMRELNDIGAKLADIDGVSAITDVTGFGLGGHLLEVCRASNVSAIIDYDKLPVLPNVKKYLQDGCSPGGAERNFDSYGQCISPMSGEVQAIICDPQTSGGLLVMASELANKELKNIGFEFKQIGEIVKNNKKPSIQIR